MEEPWIQRVRNIAKKQAHGLIDALINDDHHLILKKRNGQEVDAGEIKTRRPGSVVTIAYTTIEDESDVYLTKDGGLWLPGSSQGRWQGGTQDKPNGGCWTGDRFMVPVYNYEAGVLVDGVDPGYSQMLQSFDGGTWAFHPDIDTFGVASRGRIKGMAASGDGIVIAVGDSGMGPDEDSSMAISQDFGSTWEVISTDLDRYPFLDLETYYTPIFGVCCKNRFEWVLGNGYNFWYTFDGGGHWALVPYPNGYFSPSNTYGFPFRYFNGYWWLFGNGGGDGDEDTPLMKSENLVDWIPVITPWSGMYPQMAAYMGEPDHFGWSGTIENMEHDPFTNTILCNGSPYTSFATPMLMSTDGGEHFFEIGFRTDKAAAQAAGWDGIYEMPSWSVDIGGGIAWGFDWWFMVNPRTPDDLNPAIFRISSDGRIVEPVTPDQQFNTLSYVLLAGGYLGMEKAKV